MNPPAKRPNRPNRAQQAACPCGTGRAYSACCRPFHLGSADPATAEELMRSRYSAYAKGLPAYVRSSWHPDTCPDDVTIDPRHRWTGLTVMETVDGGEDDERGTVEFVATFATGRIHEVSEFTRVDGRWVYARELA